MIENQQPRNVIIFVGYMAWFAVLVRVLFLSTGNPYTSTGEILGSHVGLAFWLLVLSIIPYFMARARAKKRGTNVSWSYVMVGTTLIALVLSVGGFYGRTHTSSAASVSPSAADPPGTQYATDASGKTHKLVPYFGDYEPLSTPSPARQAKPAPEEGQWSCTISQNDQHLRLFLFPGSVVYMSVETDKWAQMDDLHWKSASQPRNDQAGHLLSVQLLTPTQASIQWPAGEVASCTR